MIDFLRVPQRLADMYYESSLITALVYLERSNNFDKYYNDYALREAAVETFLTRHNLEKDNSAQ